MRTLQTTNVIISSCDHSIHVDVLQSYWPMTVMNHATVYEVLPIHTIHITNETGYHLGCFLQSGIVTYRTNEIGHVITQRNCPTFDISSGHFHISLNSSKIEIYTLIVQYLTDIQHLPNSSISFNVKSDSRISSGDVALPFSTLLSDRSGWCSLGISLNCLFFLHLETILWANLDTLSLKHITVMVIKA